MRRCDFARVRVFVVVFFFLIIYLYHLSTSGIHDLFPNSYFCIDI
jgi:hypothetical protein